MSQNKEQKMCVIDVDVIINRRNAKFPELKPWTRNSVAQAIGVQPQILYDWKNGKTPNVVPRLFKLAEMGECPLQDFITITEPEAAEAKTNV